MAVDQPACALVVQACSGPADLRDHVAESAELAGGMSTPIVRVLGEFRGTAPFEAQRRGRVRLVHVGMSSFGVGDHALGPTKKARLPSNEEAGPMILRCYGLGRFLLSAPMLCGSYTHV